MRTFNQQMHDFCQIMQQEVLKHTNKMPPRPTTIEGARGFTESFLLCPTIESARSCIQKDFSGALNFVVVLTRVSLRLSEGTYKLPTQWPEFQTPFYVLGCAVLEHIDGVQQTINSPSEMSSVALK
jgi:hypothetical protein